ncbi:MAG: hypothetical protein RSB88_00990 [Akkermansia sp.]
MGFIKSPSIPKADPVPLPPPPIKVEEISEDVAGDYNAKARRRKSILSTVLAGKGGGITTSSPSEASQTTLRKTLG